MVKLAVVEIHTASPNGAHCSGRCQWLLIDTLLRTGEGYCSLFCKGTTMLKKAHPSDKYPLRHPKCVEAEQRFSR